MKITPTGLGLVCALFAAAPQPAHSTGYACGVYFSDGSTLSIVCQRGEVCTYTRGDGRKGLISKEIADEYCM